MAEGLPVWAVFDETAREVKIDIIENYKDLLGQSKRFELTATLDSLEVQVSFTVSFSNPSDEEAEVKEETSSSDDEAEETPVPKFEFKPPKEAEPPREE